MKQPAAWFAALGFVVVGYCAARHHRPAGTSGLAFAAGVSMPLLVCAGWIWSAGTLGNAAFWTWSYARQYGSAIQLRYAMQPLAINGAQVFYFSPALWILSAIGFLLCIAVSSLRRNGLVLAAFGMASLLTLSAGFYFRGHYFIFILPAASLLIGVTAWQCGRAARRTSPLLPFVIVAVFATIAATPFVLGRDLFFYRSSNAVCQTIYGDNPFVVAPAVAHFIQQETTAADRIAVLGSEPEIYFYAQRLSATGYIYMYPLMEPQRYSGTMQDQMMHEVEREKPEIIVMVTSRWSWLVQPGSDLRAVDWAHDYCSHNYDVIGLAAVDSTGAGQCYLPYQGEPVILGSNYISVYRRR